MRDKQSIPPGVSCQRLGLSFATRRLTFSPCGGRYLSEPSPLRQAFGGTFCKIIYRGLGQNRNCNEFSQMGRITNNASLRGIICATADMETIPSAWNKRRPCWTMRSCRQGDAKGGLGNAWQSRAGSFPREGREARPVQGWRQLPRQGLRAATMSPVPFPDPTDLTSRNPAPRRASARTSKGMKCVA